MKICANRGRSCHPCHVYLQPCDLSEADICEHLPRFLEETNPKISSFTFGMLDSLPKINYFLTVVLNLQENRSLHSVHIVVQQDIADDICKTIHIPAQVQQRMNVSFVRFDPVSRTFSLVSTTNQSTCSIPVFDPRSQLQ